MKLQVQQLVSAVVVPSGAVVEFACNSCGSIGCTPSRIIKLLRIQKQILLSLRHCLPIVIGGCGGTGERDARIESFGVGEVQHERWLDVWEAGFDAHGLYLVQFD
jgi:hypothetical protein